MSRFLFFILSRYRFFFILLLRLLFVFFVFILVYALFYDGGGGTSTIYGGDHGDYYLYLKDHNIGNKPLYIAICIFVLFAYLLIKLATFQKRVNKEKRVEFFGFYDKKDYQNAADIIILLSKINYPEMKINSDDKDYIALLLKAKTPEDMNFPTDSDFIHLVYEISSLISKQQFLPG